MSRPDEDREPTAAETSWDVYREFAALPMNRQHVLDHPVCEICQKNPSAAITRWGKITAACPSCLRAETAAFEQEFAEEQAQKQRLRDLGYED